ncbi:DUF418 domain-containing protein [Flammeovirga pectinis]|uniref:DUF418 domain-containing protein n=1 Tax=Flammeovirga pectinis TaxID=2494373 RepID=A0A3S9P270_9BACT|nr:DUF418 domain-containing protein [Flammeovirga pectinis]AZQ62264.1 DUF418 domain-containing protein [Flammeovirga pectinis]
MTNTTSSTITPTTGKQRLGVIDALRGFAILGILFANILSWSLYKFTPTAELNTFAFAEYDSTLHHLLNFFVDTKFYSIFSILFGVGFYLQYDRQRNNQEAFLKVYRRRLKFLILFGFIHMLFWSGDILMLYGMMAFVFILFRNQSPDRILKWAVFFMFAPLLVDAVMLYVAPGWMSPSKEIAGEAMKRYIDEDPSAVVAAFQSGNFITTFKQNVHNIMWRWFDFMPSYRPFKVLGLFLFGFYLQSKKFFTEGGRSWKVFFIFATLGTAAHLIGYQIGGSMAKFPKEASDLGFKAIMMFGQLTLALSYASLLSIIYHTSWGEKAMQPLTSVGKMSFTNYLSQTLIGIVIFYGIGFGLGGTLTLAPIFVIAVLIYIFQVTYSAIWLKKFKFGPLEWGWKCLTYSQRFPILNSEYDKIKAAKKAA